MADATSSISIPVDGSSALVPLTTDDASMALYHSFFMIIASEIGDKTFLIAAILAMRHSRLVVFAGAFGSLVVMSILSAGMGQLLPTLLPRKWTQIGAALLFLVFGVKMLKEGQEMESGQGKIQEEMREVELEIDEKQHGDNNTIPLANLESGLGEEVASTPSKSLFRKHTPSAVNDVKEGAQNFASLFFGPIFVQAFVLTFLGEWGDRSQIATIALAAAHNVYIVTFGTVLGHSICTALAVIGGRWLSTKISIKHVTLGGAVLFLIFALIYFHEAFTCTDTSVPITPTMSYS